MNDLALVEYLLKRYIQCLYDTVKDKQMMHIYEYYAFYRGSADEIKYILKDRFGMLLIDTLNYVEAYNSVTSVRVRKEAHK